MQSRPSRASRGFGPDFSMFGGSERAPNKQRRRYGPIVRPKVEFHTYEASVAFARSRRARTPPAAGDSVNAAAAVRKARSSRKLIRRRAASSQSTRRTQQRL